MPDTPIICPFCQTPQKEFLDSSGDPPLCSKCVRPIPGASGIAGDESTDISLLRGSSLSLAQQILNEQRRRFEAGDAVAVEALLAKSPALLADSDAVLDLICNEFILRRQHKQPAPIEEYLERFPQFADEIKMQFEVERALDDGDLLDTSQLTSDSRAAQESGIADATIDDPNAPGAASASFHGARSDEPRYQIVRSHARGGLGEVFIARDQELRRDVALKEIQSRHADDAGSRARFLQEAEITGRLEHPGIVPIYGLNVYEDGRPYYAMRFIQGESLKSAIQKLHNPKRKKRRPSERLLELRQLLGRFQDACNAIAYAHSRGVIHRDIKPDNIMLGEFGETLVVDWGLAKIFESRESGIGNRESGHDVESADGSSANQGKDGEISGADAQHATESGAILGTPAFMSPEQASGELRSLTPASDVYSLGATLYCLLTGKPPVQGKSVVEVLFSVRSGQYAPPRQVDSSVPAALEAICQKSMALRPQDRYASASDIAKEIDRWLGDEPVTAHREAWTLRFARWRRRHKTLVTSASLLVFATLIAIALGAWIIGIEQAKTADANNRLYKERIKKLRTQQQLTLAEKKTLDEQAKRLNEQQAKLKALFRAEKISGYLFGILRSPDPTKNAKAYDIRIGAVLDDAVRKVEADFKNDPQTRADILEELALTYHHLGVPATSENLYRRSLALRKTTLGYDHPDTLESLRLLGRACAFSGKTAEAVTLLSECHDKMGTQNPVHPSSLSAMNDFGLALLQADEPEKAHNILADSQRRHIEKFGEKHTETLRTNVHLARALCALKKSADAVALAKETHAQLKAGLGDDHPETLSAMMVLALGHASQNKHSTALSLLSKNLEHRKRRLGPLHRDSVQTMTRLGHTYVNLRMPDKAVPLFEKANQYWQSELDGKHPTALAALDDLGKAHHLAGHTNKAVPLLQKVLQHKQAEQGEKHASTLATQLVLADALHSLGQFREAAPHFEQILNVAPANLDGYAEARGKLLHIYQSLSQFAEANKLIQKMVIDTRRNHSADSLPLASVLALAAHNHVQTGQFAAAEPLCRECLAIRAKKLPDHWLLFNIKSMLGASLAGQNKLAEAEAVMLEGYRGMIARENEIPAAGRARLTESVRDLVELYRRMGNKDELKKWQNNLQSRIASGTRIISGKLTKNDPKKARTGPFHIKSHELRFEAGRFYAVEVKGRFRTAFQIIDPRNNDKIVTKSSGESWDERDSHTIFMPPRTDTYHIDVRNRGSQMGEYFLHVSEFAPAGGKHEFHGKLTSASGTNNGKLYKGYRVQLEAGRTCLLKANSSDFDPYLMVVDPVSRRILAQHNDISSTNRNARLVFTPNATTKYYIVAQSNVEGQIGEFDLIIESFEKIPTGTRNLRQLADAYQHIGRFHEAIPLLEKLLAIRKNQRDYTHPQVQDTLQALTYNHVYAGEPHMAIPLLEEQYKRAFAMYGPQKGATFVAAVNLGAAYWATGEYQQALTLFRRTAAATPETLPKDAPWVHFTFDASLSPPDNKSCQEMTLLAGNLEKAVIEKLGDKQLLRVTMMNTSILACLYRGAAASQNKVRGLMREFYDNGHPHLQITQFNFTAEYQHMKNAIKIMQSQRNYLNAVWSGHGPDDLRTMTAAADFANALIHANDVLQALSVAKDCQMQCEKELPNHWLLYFAKSLHGDCLSRRKKYVDAEPLLLAGYEGLAQRQASLPPSRRRIVNDAVQRLVEHYGRRKQTENAELWRKKLSRDY